MSSKNSSIADTNDVPVSQPDGKEDVPYHKGQIAERLLAEARNIMATELVEDVTARRLCRAVGVTSANFYNHYPTLEYLLLEIAAQEFDRQHKQNLRILRRGLSRDDAVLLVTQYCVDFSVRHHQLHRIMYGHVPDSSINPNYMSAADAGMRTLVHIIYGEDRYDPEDLVKSHESCAKAYAYVAFMSGLASGISRQIFANPSGTRAERRNFVETLTRIFLTGLGPEGGTSDQPH